MAQTTELELVAIVDENGDYGVGADADAAREDYANRIQPTEDAACLRTFKLKLSVPVPAVVELSACVADEGGEVALSAA